MGWGRSGGRGGGSGVAVVGICIAMALRLGVMVAVAAVGLLDNVHNGRKAPGILERDCLDYKGQCRRLVKRAKLFLC